MMNRSLLAHLQINFLWATWSRWPDTRVLNTPLRPNATGHAVWFLKSGKMNIAEIGEDDCVLREWQVNEKQMFIWPQRRRRRVLLEQPSEWYSVGMDAYLFGHINLWNALNPPCRITLDQQQIELVDICIKTLITLRSGPDTIPMEAEPHLLAAEKLPEILPLTALGHWQALSLSQAIFSLCWMKQSNGTSLPEILPGWLSDALHLAETQPRLKVKNLAQHVGFSESQFRRLFVQWVGMPPHQYLHQQRLQQAQRLLETTDTTCADISAQLGFNSLSHFTHTFKSSFGNTPARYRQEFLRSTHGD